MDDQKRKELLNLKEQGEENMLYLKSVKVVDFARYKRIKNALDIINARLKKG